MIRAGTGARSGAPALGPDVPHLDVVKDLLQQSTLVLRSIARCLLAKEKEEIDGVLRLIEVNQALPVAGSAASPRLIKAELANMTNSP